MLFKTHPRVAVLVQWAMVTGLFLTVIIFGAILVYREHQQFTFKIAEIHKQKIHEQEAIVRDEVEQAIEYMNFSFEQTDIQTRDKLKDRVNEAYGIIENVYQQNLASQDKVETIIFITETLRPIRFFEGRGYFKIIQSDGTLILDPINPSAEGTNVLDVTDTAGIKYVEKIINAIGQDEGYIECQCLKPTEIDGTQHPKLIYGKYYKPLDWYILTGEYQDEVATDMQDEVNNYLTIHRFGENKKGYVFVIHLLDINGGEKFGVMYANANRPDLIGNYISDEYRDAKGKQYRKEFLAGLREKGKCYVDYWYKRLDNPEPVPKTSFFKLTDDGQYIVAAGFYHPDITAQIQEEEALLKTKVTRDLLLLGGILTLMVVIMLLAVRYFSRLIDDQVSALLAFFQQASHRNQRVAPPNLGLVEFRQLAESADDMLQSRMMIETMLFDEKERLATTLRSIGDGVIVTDINGVVQLVNRKAERLTGYSQVEANGQLIENIFMVTSTRGDKILSDVIQKVISTKNTVTLEEDLTLTDKQGKSYTISDSVAPIQDKSSEIVGVVIVFRDISDQRKMERDLFKAQQLESLGVLAGGIAHDFNNLLTAIFGNVSLAKLLTNPDDKLYELLTQSEDAMERAKQLTQQLLTFSKGGSPIRNVQSINEILQSVAQFNLRGSNVKLNTNIPDDLWAVNVDKGQISQVIANLVINAKHAMPNGGEITITAKNVEDHNLPLNSSHIVQIDICDTGAGIPSQNLEKIFEPYFSTKTTGNGLGLTSVYSIIKRHEGFLDVESTVGIGTTFIIYLPAEPYALNGKRVETLNTEPESELTDTVLNILLMDDDVGIRNVCGNILQNLGHLITYASDGNEVLKLYREAQNLNKLFDLVILDLTIPGGMGGEETMKELLKIDTAVKAIVSSGYASNPIMAHYEKYGFIGMLEKPYQVDNIKAILQIL